MSDSELDLENAEELKNLAVAALKISRIRVDEFGRPRTSNEAFDKIIEGIRHHPRLVEIALKVLTDMQIEWPMPEEGRKQLFRDLGISDD